MLREKFMSRGNALKNVIWKKKYVQLQVPGILKVEVGRLASRSLKLSVYVHLFLRQCSAVCTRWRKTVMIQRRQEASVEWNQAKAIDSWLEHPSHPLTPLLVSKASVPRIVPAATDTWVLSGFSHVWLFATLWTIASQALLSMGFSRQEYWSVLPCSPPGNLPNPGVEPASLMSPAFAGGFFTTSADRPSDGQELIWFIFSGNSV